MRRFTFALLFPLLSCSQAPGPVATPANDAVLDRHLRSYVVGFLLRNPTVNTYLGGAGLDPSLVEADGRLRDHSQTAIDEEDAWLDAVRAALLSIAPATLAAKSRIDRDVAIAQIDYQLHLHRVRQYQRRSVDTYTDEPFRAIDFQLQGMTQTGASTYGTPEEWSLVVRRLNAIPWYLTNAQSQLTRGIETNTTADYRMLFRNGIGSSTSAAKYFETTLPQLAAERVTGPKREALLSQVRIGSAVAANAFRNFAQFIGTTFFDDVTRQSGIKPRFAGDKFAFGESEYNWALTHNLRVGKNAGQLYEEAWPIVLQTQRDMTTLAQQIVNSRGWMVPPEQNVVQFVFDQLGKDYPKSDAEMISWYRDTAFRLVDYARHTGLFDVPGDYKLDVTETPPPLRASIDSAAYYPAPPFKKTGVGRFYVTPTEGDVALLQQNNRSALADLAAHEGFPGHDWYYKVLSANPSSPVRWLTPGSVEDSSSMWEDSLAAEGWGLYAEALMAEPQPGAPNGFYTPEERLYQLQGKLYRDLRVRVDTGIHTGRMSYDEAVDLFSQVVDFLPGSCRAGSLSEAKRASCTTAERAIFRYSKWPTQAITYRLGKDQIYELRRQAETDLKRFHLLFIQQGTIPPGYFGAELSRRFRG